MKKIAVILCGSGFKDGSEIRESVGVLLSLDQNNAHYECFAPDLPQYDVVNGLTGSQVKSESRNMLIEAARIARGKIKPLQELHPEEFDGLIIPGGFGVAKNLCDYASAGERAEVNSTLVMILNSFYELKKPIGVVCISPILIALNFKNKGIKLTLGQSPATLETLLNLGQKPIECDAHSFVWDEHHLIGSTPAYMIDDARLSDIFQGINGIVKKVLASK